MRIAILVAALLIALFSNAEARQRQAFAPECNVTMPCIGAPASYERGQAKSSRYARAEFGSPIVAPETQRSFLRGEVLGGRPPGCPRRFCGCGVSLKVFGRIIPELNLAANWRRFASALPGAGTVAWRPGHVLYVEAHVGGNDYQVYDPNSGGGKIRRHVRNLAGYRFVDPHGAT